MAENHDSNTATDSFSSHFRMSSWWNPSSHKNPRGKYERAGTAVSSAAGGCIVSLPTRSRLIQSPSKNPTPPIRLENMNTLISCSSDDGCWNMCVLRSGNVASNFSANRRSSSTVCSNATPPFSNVKSNEKADILSTVNVWLATAALQCGFIAFATSNTRHSSPSRRKSHVYETEPSDTALDTTVLPSVKESVNWSSSNSPLIISLTATTENKKVKSWLFRYFETPPMLKRQLPLSFSVKLVQKSCNSVNLRLRYQSLVPKKLGSETASVMLTPTPFQQSIIVIAI